MRRAVVGVCCLFVFALVGCTDGELQSDDAVVISYDDGGNGTNSDGTSSSDASSSSDTPVRRDSSNVRYDTGVGKQDTQTGKMDTHNNLCGGRGCGSNAVCRNNACQCKSGYTGDPYAGCHKKMQQGCGGGNKCGKNALCVNAKCKCVAGFKPDGSGGCNRTTVGDPAKRTKSQVCQRWSKVSRGGASTMWKTQPTGDCDPGELSGEVIWNALNATSGFRWLVGLDPVTYKDNYLEITQEAATALAAEGKRIQHKIPMSYKCYSQKAHQGASSSNLSQGTRTAASTVYQYIQDRGNPTLGHRMWIFNPSMGATGFGHRGRYGAMYAFDGSGPDNQADTFYPSPGYFPKSALLGPWSYSTKSASVSNPSVTVEEVKSGKKLSVSGIRSLSGGYRRPGGVGWKVSGAQTGVEYKITISGVGGGKKSYTTTLVSCP